MKEGSFNFITKAGGLQYEVTTEVTTNSLPESNVGTISFDFVNDRWFFISNLWITRDEMKEILTFLDYLEEQKETENE